ncbi:MAG: mannose-1-phosphate guanylyltransferase/mannose-6-phosphate isomerase [Proteobacteria bacterium CG1_02_64_396]|nr:MAG: mannose-1-phosphate guanylyltransferase/mannose-6-phosphate isomerase [Proteobacteria bacterium CG1_02_64_396]
MIGVVLAGGSGSRLWPLSRESTPKQILSLQGEESLLQDTLTRLKPLTRQRVVVTSVELQTAVRRQLPGNVEVWSEPFPRDTAAAIGLTALRLRRADPNAVMLIFPADHHIQDQDRLNAAVQQAEAAATSGDLVVFGITPTSPHTGYGYIEVEAPPEQAPPATLSVRRFVEKPDRPTAEQYLKSGRFYWNAGMFVWRADAILQAIEAYMPDLARGLQTIAAVLGSPDEDKVTREVFVDLPKVSIDFGILEKANNVRVVTTDFRWTDLGNFDALYEISDKDDAGNVISGDVVALGASGSLIQSNSRLVAAIGVENMVVIETPDAVLVASRDRSQDVKAVVEALKKQGRDEVFHPRQEDRPWGWFGVLDEGPTYKIKRIKVFPGATLSLQLHHHRSEHWVVVRGAAEVEVDGKVQVLTANQSVYVPSNTKHRLANPGVVPLELIEVQCGEYLGEDDIVRFEDRYGAVGTVPDVIDATM